MTVDTMPPRVGRFNGGSEAKNGSFLSVLRLGRARVAQTAMQEPQPEADPHAAEMAPVLGAFPQISRRLALVGVTHLRGLVGLLVGRVSG